MPFRLQTYICQSLVFMKMLALVITGWICAQQVWQALSDIERSQNRLAITKQAADQMQLLTATSEPTLLEKNKAEQIQKKIEGSIKKLSTPTLNENESPQETGDRFSETENVRRMRELENLLSSLLAARKEMTAGRAADPEGAKIQFRRDMDVNFLPRLRTFADNSYSTDQSHITTSTTHAFETVTFYGVIVIVLAALTMIGHAFSGYLHRSLAGPLEELSNSMEQLTRDNHDIEIKRTSLSSETTQLIANFNNLARHLKDKSVQQTSLESQVEKRTRELTEANNKLKQLDTMRAQFLADISHELRTPLTSIKGEAEIRLRRDNNSEEDYRSTLSRVKVMSDQMNFLVDDLLFIARSEKDTVSFQFKDSDLEGVVSAVVHNYEVLATEQENEIRINWPDEPLEISMDTFRLKQALNILLDNALKFSYPKTSVEITITCTKENAILKVRNKGDQILPEDIPYVFDRFYTGQLKQKTPSSSGLGLSIAKWIIEKHYGEISLTSNPEGITEVTIILPRVMLSEALPQIAGGAVL